MKKTLTIIGLAAATLAGASAQVVYNYDFGTGTGNFTTASTISTTFLPAPPTGGGSDLVRIGSAGGRWSLENPGNSTLGSGSELVGVAPTSGSLNKFSVHDFSSATASFSMSFSMILSGGSSGTWYMFAGNGATFSDANGFSGIESYLGLRWVFGASNAITTNNRSAGSWSTSTLSSTPFVQNEIYNVEVYANNTAATLNYSRSGAQSTSAYTWDLWVNGSLVGDNLAKAQLANATVIDSFMFYGESSTGNVATIRLDSFMYGTTITVIPEPATWAGLGLLVAFALLNLRRRRAVAA